MVRKIALIGARLSTNLGGPSLLVSTKMALSTVFPDADYTLFVPTDSYESDKMLAPRYGVKVLPFYRTKWLPLLALLRRWTKVLTGSASSKATITALEEADVIIDIWGILFADQIVSNTFRSGLAGGFKFVLGKMLGKPVIKYTADLGPFNYKWNRIFSKLYLGHFVDLILVRDKTSYKCVEELGIKTPILTVPDTAFLLQPCESKESEFYAALRKEGPLIGLSVSFQARNRASDPAIYLTTMKEFVKYLIAKYSAHVVVIPNEVSETAANDARIAEEIRAEVADDCCEALHIDSLLAQEIKGVINQCDVIVASRYHTIVAALSLGIPTLAIGWHHKYMGVLEFFKQEHWLCDIKDLELEDLIKKFEALWNNREKVRETILSYLPDVKERIAAGARETRKIISEKSKR